jgi:dihydrofolate reductase
VLGGDVASEVAALKQRPGKHILKYGTGELDRTLLESRLIDELRISLVPVVIGAGRHLFDGVSPPTGFQLAGTKTFENGIIRLTYGTTY